MTYKAATYSEPEFKGMYSQLSHVNVRIYRRTVKWTRKQEFQYKATINESIFNDDDPRWQWDFSLQAAVGSSLLEVAGYWDGKDV